jgi:hypothetical protein
MLSRIVGTRARIALALMLSTTFSWSLALMTEPEESSNGGFLVAGVIAV